MLEEIKKEIEENIVVVNDYYDNETEVICKEILYEILDKYKNQHDYKGAWGELNEKLSNYFELNFADTNVQSYMRELGQKYNLGGK